MTKSYFRGHPIVFVGGVWRYADTKEPTVGNERQCGHCEKENTKEGHDGCLGILPNVMNACCGHGNVDEAYVQFDKNKRISGSAAVAWIIKNKEGDNIMEGDKEYREKLLERYPAGIPGDVQHTARMVMVYYFENVDYTAECDGKYSVTIRVKGIDAGIVQDKMIEKMPARADVKVYEM